MRKRKENKIKISQIIKTFKEKKYKIKLNMIYMFLFYDIILNIIFFSSFMKCNCLRGELASSYIILKIKGKGNIKIYDRINKPNIATINNSINYTVNGDQNNNNFINLENDISNITLIWNTPPSSTNNLFKGCCSHIIEIDLSNFDSSFVENMAGMFYLYSSLNYIDLSNFNTSSVTNMNNMFYGCSELIYLDLSFFDTSKVIKMENMFYRCSKLISLDLSNFNTSTVITMLNMFSGCSALTYLNLSNFDTSQVNNMYAMFSDVQI